MGRKFFFFLSEGAPRALWGPGAGTHVSSGQNQWGHPRGSPQFWRGCVGGTGQDGDRGAVPVLVPVLFPAQPHRACRGRRCHSNLGTGRALGAESAAALCKQQRGEQRRVCCTSRSKNPPGPCRAGKLRFQTFQTPALPRLSGPRAWERGRARSRWPRAALPELARGTEGRVTVPVALWGHRGAAEAVTQRRIRAGLSAAHQGRRGCARGAPPQWHPQAGPEPGGAPGSPVSDKLHRKPREEGNCGSQSLPAVRGQTGWRQTRPRAEMGREGDIAGPGAEGWEINSGKEMALFELPTSEMALF